MLHKKGNNLPAGSIADDDDDGYANAIALALNRELGRSRHAVKTLTRWTGASERTAKNWINAKRGPSGEDLVALAKHSNEVMRAFHRLAGRSELDAGIQAELHHMLNRAIALLQP